MRLDSQAAADWAQDGRATYPTRRVYGEPYMCYGTNCTPPAASEIFVIAAMHPDRVSDTLGDSLRECSSESDDSDVSYAFLNHSTPEELEATFADIANQLRVVRRVY